MGKILENIKTLLKIGGTVAAIGAGAGIAGQAAVTRGDAEQIKYRIEHADNEIKTPVNSIRDSTHYVTRNLRSADLSLSIARNAYKEAKEALKTFEQGMPHTNQNNIESMKIVSSEIRRLARAVAKIEDTQETGRKERLFSDLIQVADNIDRVAR